MTTFKDGVYYHAIKITSLITTTSITLEQDGHSGRVAWCDKHIAPARSRLSSFGVHCVYWFKTEEQAVMFKLKFGGKYTCYLE